VRTKKTPVICSSTFIFIVQLQSSMCIQICLSTIAARLPRLHASRGPTAPPFCRDARYGKLLLLSFLSYSSFCFYFEFRPSENTKPTT
jgi:hypothetical protein